MMKLTRHPFFREIVPLEGMKDATGNLGESVHDVSTKRHVNVLGEVLDASRTVLGPVGVVAHLRRRNERVK